MNTRLHNKGGYKKMRLKWPKLKEITRLNFQNSVFLLTKNRNYVMITFKMLKVAFQFKHTRQTHGSEVTHGSECISVKFRKILRKSHAQFREKVRKWRLRLNDGFLTKKCIIQTTIIIIISLITITRLSPWKSFTIPLATVLKTRAIKAPEHCPFSSFLSCTPCC